MLRIHCVQLFYNLSDPGMEDLLCEAESVGRFAGLSCRKTCPTRPLSSTSATSWSGINWTEACSMRSTPT